MSDKPTISVVVPVYNVAPYLEECIGSIFRQSFRDFELILIDDGSSDGSQDICDAAAKSSPSQIRVLHCSNGGSSVARNRGIDAAGGAYIAFVDSDDVVHPDYLRRLYELSAGYDADISMVKFSEGSVPDYASLRPMGCEPVAMSGEEALERTLYQDGLDTSPCCKLYRRDIFSSERFKPGILYEDLDLVTRILPSVDRVVFSRERLYCYRKREGSNIGSFSMKRLDVLDVTSDIERRVGECCPRLLPAARDRRLSAAFNMFLLLAANGMAATDEATRCWNMIKELRGGELGNPRVRLKNKLGVLLSFLGRRALAFTGRMI